MTHDARPSVSTSLIASLAPERASAIASAPIPEPAPVTGLPCRELIVALKTEVIAIVPVMRW